MTFRFSYNPLDAKCTPVTVDFLLKRQYQSEDLSSNLWKEKWGWITDEYRELKRQTDEFNKQIKVDAEEKPKVAKSILPFPETVNGEYGWLANKKDFSLLIPGLEKDSPRKIQLWDDLSVWDREKYVDKILC